MDSVDIPLSWEKAADKIASRSCRRILVIGATDRGKSSFCKFISRRLMSAGHKVAVVDGDIGQKDIGPPATITLGYPVAAADTLQVKPAALYFVGTVSPVGHFIPMIVGTRRLMEEARSDFVIINTTGFIHGGGRDLKGYLIELVQPATIVAIEKQGELQAILKAYRGYSIIRISPSVKAAAKSPVQRKRNRELAWQAYFADARESELDVSRLTFQRTLLFSGQRVQDDRFLYAERTSEGLIAVAAGAPLSEHGLTLLHAGFEQNLVCGLADRRNHVLGLGIIRKLDFATAKIALWTPVLAAKIHVIQFGNIYVSPDGHELNHKWARR